jgi:TPR repeat protein
VVDCSAHHASYAAKAASSSANSVVWNSKDSLSLTNNSSVDYIKAVNLEIFSAKEFFYSVK